MGTSNTASVIRPGDVLAPWSGIPADPPKVLARSKVRIVDLRSTQGAASEKKAGGGAGANWTRVYRDVEIKNDRCWQAGQARLRVAHVFGAFGAVPITTYNLSAAAGVSGTSEANDADAATPAWTDRDEKMAEKFDGTSAFVQAPGGSNYYHWMLEVVPRIALLRPALVKGEVDRVVLGNAGKPFQRQSVEMLFADIKDRIVFLKRPLGRFERLLFFENYRGDTRITPATIRLVEEIRASAITRQPPSKKIYVERGKDNMRRRLVDNERLLQDLFVRGFEAVEGAALTVPEQRAAFESSGLVVGTHGAGLTNMMFSPRHCNFIEITSNQYVSRVPFSDLAVATGINATVVLVDEVGNYARVEKNWGNDLTFGSDAAYRRFLELVDA